MKYFLISGGGSGIGRAIARRLSQDRNHSIVVCGRSIHALKETLDLLEFRANHEMLQIDVTQPDSIARGVKDYPYDHIDTIVANAGVGGENHFGPSDRWDEIVATNLTGTYRFVSSFLPLLLKSDEKYRHIVVMSSILARLGVPGYTAYCASKAGLLGLTRSWAVEWAPKNILVNAICPGWVETKMAEDGIQGIAAKTGKTRQEAYEAAMSAVPLKKMATPAEIAELVGYLTTQQSITGQVLDINNGAVMA
jgi:NAD(P)-dependent dehydrogenase (short-subunit alcohol dehydrogenase family)